MIDKNIFLPKEHAGEVVTEIELIRSTPEEKGQQIDNVANFQHLPNDLTPAAHAVVGGASAPSDKPTNALGLAYLQKAARDRQNVFAALMQAVKTHSLGQISHALYEIGGEYRRNM